MNKKTIVIIVFAMLILATACAQQGIEPISQSASIQTSEQGGEEIQPTYEGLGPLELDPDNGIGDSAAAPDSQDESFISSSGEISSSRSKSAEPGFAESVAPSNAGINLEESLDFEWLTYQDKEYSFSIDYPSTYTILPEKEEPSNLIATKVHQVRFQDIQLATGETAEFELPAFLIEVFDPGEHSLEAFISRDEPDGFREEYQETRLRGVRVYFNQLIAPSEFYYFSSQGYVYKLTPLGQFGLEMLESFDIQ